MKLSENYCLSLTQRNMLLKRYHCHNAQKLLEPPKWSWQICYQYYIYVFMNIKQKCFAIQLFRAFFSIFWLLENWTVILNASNLPSFFLANEKFPSEIPTWVGIVKKTLQKQSLWTLHQNLQGECPERWLLLSRIGQLPLDWDRCWAELTTLGWHSILVG